MHPVDVIDQAVFSDGTTSSFSNVSAGAIDSDTSYSHLGFLTLQATFQAMLICLIGYGAGRKGWLTKPGQKILSNLNVQVFTPCLIFSKMGSSLSLSALPDLAIIPVLFVLTTGVSYLCGRFMSRAFRFNNSESNFVTAMAVFGNSNSLPVSLTVSLAQALPFLKWPDIPADNSDAVASRGLLYLLIFQQLGQMVRWSWGFNTLLAKPLEVQAEERLSRSSLDVERQTSMHQLRQSRSLSTTSSGVETPIPEVSARGFIKTVAKEIWEFMNPPLWSILVALVVSSITPLKNAMFIDQSNFLYQTFGTAIQKVGGLAIPLILIVLGSNFAPGTGEEPPRSANCNKLVIASLLSRIVLPATILLPTIALACKYLKISILDDPIFLVASFILTVSPPAIQLAQITQLNGVFEAEMASVLFWGYVVITPPSSVLIVVLALEVLKWTGITQ